MSSALTLPVRDDQLRQLVVAHAWREIAFGDTPNELAEAAD